MRKRYIWKVSAVTAAITLFLTGATLIGSSVTAFAGDTEYAGSTAVKAYVTAPDEESQNPEKPDEQPPDEADSGEGSKDGGKVKTGDTGTPAVWGVTLLASVAAAGCGIVLKRKSTHSYTASGKTLSDKHTDGS